MIIDNSIFWIKFQDVNGKIMYLNKAYVKSIITPKERVRTTNISQHNQHQTTLPTFVITYNNNII